MQNTQTAAAPKPAATKWGNWAHTLVRYAQQAVLYEAVLEPKPGLVDPGNAGAHTDMDIFTFMDSASSLYEGLFAFAMSGFQHEGDEASLFASIRPVGIEVEKNMLQETKGVNTHKGMIFSMGIVLAAVAFTVKKEQDAEGEFPVFSPEQSDRIFAVIQLMTEGLISHDFGKLGTKKHLTNGEALFLKHGFLGIRGEAEAGFPSIQERVLPYLREQAETRDGYSAKHVYLDSLFLLMAEIEDSTIVSRGGLEALEYVKRTAADFLSKGGMRQNDAFTQLRFMNEEFCAKRISPGGAADLLALAVFFSKLEQLTLGG